MKYTNTYNKDLKVLNDEIKNGLWYIFTASALSAI